MALNEKASVAEVLGHSGPVRVEFGSVPIGKGECTATFLSI